MPSSSRKTQTPQSQLAPRPPQQKQTLNLKPQQKQDLDHIVLLFQRAFIGQRAASAAKQLQQLRRLAYTGFLVFGVVRQFGAYG